MSQTTGYTVRTLDQEIDAVVICPGHTDHVVVATYSLIKSENTAEENDADEDGGDQSEAPRRVGSLQVLPIDFDTSSSSAESSSLCRARTDFPCAILDIRFHPSITGLLGAATSIGEVRFFEVTWSSSGQTKYDNSNDDDDTRVQIIPLGKVAVSDDTTTLITQFVWIDVLQQPAPPLEAGQALVRTIHLATCDTTGQVKLIRVGVPLTSHPSTTIVHDANGDQILRSEAVDVHKHLHDLEAWTTASIRLPDDPADSRQLILSGGDDSCFIASTMVIDTAVSADSEGFLIDSPLRVHLDRRTHSAGVVSILPLEQIVGDSIPVLTGSYDQFLRLVMFDPATNKFTTASELELGGGVWRTGLLTTYVTNDDGDAAAAAAATSASGEQSRDWILLVSAMHAGCYIVRLSLTAARHELIWTWHVETMFREPHESMVYASVAVEDTKQVGRWVVVSTSFYDKRVCVWRWTDPTERQA